MAPLTKWSTQLMLSYATTKLGLEKPCHDTPKSVSPPIEYAGSAISATSWGFNRMDIYGVDNHGSLAHQFWDGYQWNPAYNKTESLGNGVGSVPIAVSRAAGTTDVFQIAKNGSLMHQYYDGTGWRPSSYNFETLEEYLPLKAPLSVTVNGANAIDIFGKGAVDNKIYHKYYDGSSWQPGYGLEKLDDGSTQISSGPAAVSWGLNRTDVFALDDRHRLIHQFWDGTTWLKTWEVLGDAELASTPTAISWGENRLDVFGFDSAGLCHLYWDGSQWSDWEDLGKLDGDDDLALVDIIPVAATSWSADRIDVVALGTDGGYYYKYWDGSQWQPSEKGFISKGGRFVSAPAVVSWGKDRLDIFGVAEADTVLKHTTWYGNGWYPSDNDFETLGGPLAVFE